MKKNVYLCLKFNNMDTLEYKMGVMVGQHILSNFLPSLNIEGAKYNNGVDVSKEDSDKLDILTRKWFNIKDKNSDEYKSAWKDRLDFYHELLVKYLPHKLRCTIPIDLTEIENIIDVKNGIKDCLWDSDICSYDIELDNIIIEPSEHQYCWYKSIVRLTLGEVIKNGK